MGFLGIRSVSESEELVKKDEEAAARRRADPAYLRQEGQRLVKMLAPQIASMRKARADKAAAASAASASMERPIMKISRPPLPGKFVKIASSIGVPLETMVGM